MGFRDALMVSGFDLLGHNRTFQVHWLKRVVAFFLDLITVFAQLWSFLFLDAMLFVTQLKVLPGQWKDATRLFKHPKIPNNVMVHEFLGLLGKPDALVIFEAVDAATAADFMVQFSRVTEATTSLALPIEEFKWTW